MNVFQLRTKLIEDYEKYIRSFINIADPRIQEKLSEEIKSGLLWPEALIQLNPSFEPGEWIDDLVKSGVLHKECAKIFRKDKGELVSEKEGKPFRLYKHQSDAIKIALEGHNFILTTGTASGKSMAYIVPIVDYVLRHGSGVGIKAIIVYPMNALANSQANELKKFLCHGYPDGRGPVTFARYTGQENDQEKQRIINTPPDILLTNYVMLELILTRPQEKPLIATAKGLHFLVLDELHTYRGRQGADVSMLVRRVRDSFDATHLQCVGTSATLAGPGTYEEQRAEVAQVASTIFGAPVRPEHVIVETLRRATPDVKNSDSGFIEKLRQRIENIGETPSLDYAGFINDPLSIWIERTFGITRESATGRLTRTDPKSITGDKGAAHDLSMITGIPESRCAEAIEQQLLVSYQCETNPETGFPPFAFRLHQFISRGDTMYASLEPEETRYLTVHGQQFVPGDQNRVLLPLVFCRECGQEYYCVRLGHSDESKKRAFVPRELSDGSSDDDSEAGFLYVNSRKPWPTDEREIMDRVPDDWLEIYRGMTRIRRDRQKALPRLVAVSPAGVESDSGLDCSYIPAPFRFCLNCGVSYGSRQKSDFPKLSSLATEGRSTATTILSLSSITYLRKDTKLDERAKKLLSFTDNRQDASLQAGHFNDFVDIGLLRSALYKAIAACVLLKTPGSNLVY